MSFHKPPELRWDPQAVKKNLRRAKIDAYVVDGRVQFEIADPRDPQAVQVLKEIFPERAFGPLTMEVVHNPNRFIANVRLEYGLGRSWELKCELVENILVQYGCVQLTEDLEGQIARKYCSDTAAVEALEAAIERHRQLKESLVEAQDFAAAARERDAQDATRLRLDAMVKNAAAERGLV